MSRIDAELLITAGVEGMPHLDRLIERIDAAGGETGQLKDAAAALRKEWDNLDEKQRAKRLHDLARAANNGARDIGLLGKKVKETAEELDAISQAKITLGIADDEKIKAQLDDVTQAYKTLTESGELTGAKLARANELHRKKVEELEEKLGHIKPTLASLTAEMGKVTAAAGGLTLVAKEAIEFERAMAGVKKVVDGTDEEIAALGEQIKDLAYELGLVPEAVAAITAQGGQLGVAFADLPEFTRLAGQMSVAFGLTAEQSAEAAAKISNVFGITLDEMRALGDAINVLGNNTAAKESEITEAMLRIGGTAKQFGLAAEQTAALADAFIALGQPPQVAATAINALLTKMQTAPAQTDKFKTALDDLGISADELAQNIKNNPEQAIIDFLARLEQLDQQSRAIVITELFGAEYADNISLAAGSLDTLRTAFGLVADKTQTAGAMQREFEAAMSTTGAKIDQAKIAVGNMAKTLGQQLLPIIASVAEGIGGAATAINDFAERFPLITQFATYIAGAKVAMIAFGSAARLSAGAMQLLSSHGATSAGAFTQMTPALTTVKNHLLSASQGMRGMTAGMIAQQAAAGGAALAMRGLGLAMRALLANPLGLAITGIVAAMQLFDGATDTVSARMADMEAAAENADKAVDALKTKLNQGINLDVGEVKQALGAIEIALIKSRDAVLTLQNTAGRIDGLGKVFEGLKDIIPFWDSYNEKLEEAQQEQQRLNEELELMRQLQEQAEGSAALERFVEQQQRAADASKGISEQSRNILDDLQKVHDLADIVTAEQVKALDNTLTKLSSTAAVDEAARKIHALFNARKITYDEETILLDTLAAKKRALAQEELQLADASNKTVTYSAEQIKALGDAYDALGVKIPAALGAMTQSDTQVTESFARIINTTKISADEMSELLAGAFAKIETDAAAQKIGTFYKQWLEKADITTQQAAALTKQYFDQAAKAGGGLSGALKTLNLDVDEFATGVSTRAHAALDAFSVAAVRSDGDVNRVARAYNAAAKQARGNAEEVKALEAALLSSVGGDIAKADAVKKIAESFSDTRDAAQKAKTEAEKSLSALGLVSDDIKNKLSSGVTDLTGHWQRGMAQLRAEGQLTADAVNTAFTTSLGKLKSAADFRALHDALRQTGVISKLSAENLAILRAGMQGGAEAAQAYAEKLQKNTDAKKANKEETEKLTKADKENAEAKEEAAESTEKDAEAKENAAEAAEKEAEAKEKAAEATDQSAESDKKSTAAKKEAESATFALFDATNLTADAMDFLAKKSGDWAKSMHALFQSSALNSNHVNQLARDISAYADAMRQAQIDIDVLNAKVGAGTVTMNDIADATLIATKSMWGLDNTTLNNLNAAIDAARQKLADMQQAAEDTRASLEAQLASLRGDDSVAQALNEQKKLRELNIKLQDAERKGQKEIADEYRKAIELQKQVFEEERRQRARRKEEEAKRELEAKRKEETPQPGSSASSSARPGSTSHESISAKDVADAWDARIAEAERRGAENFANELYKAAKRRPT